MEVSEQQRKVIMATKDAVSALMGRIRFPGIIQAGVKTVALGSDQLQEIMVDLEQRGSAEIALSSDVELFLQISNTDLLRAIESAEFSVRLTLENTVVRATASTVADWGSAWERGIEPVKERTLEGIRGDVSSFGFPEGSYTFQAAMILLTSEFTGPYTECIARFLGYQRAFVQVIGARLQEAGIWDVDQVRCEEWHDREQGGVAFLLDVMTADGTVICNWSSESDSYLYRLSDTQSPRFAI